MEQAEMTFPEAPEWSANWGEMEALTPPYIRWSGQKDRAGDWTGELSLSGLPATVQGGNVSLKVRVTQDAKFGVWVRHSSGSGAVKYFNLEANRTYALQVPVQELADAENVSIQKVGVGLFDVPAYQYMTLFIDDISLSCVLSDGEALSAASSSSIQSENAAPYTYSDIPLGKSSREGKFMTAKVPATSSAYSSEERLKFSGMTSANFVLDESEHNQIVAFMSASDLSAQRSRDGWFRNMYFVERNRLKDSVIPNPKALFYEAEIFAAGKDYRAMPLLIGNVDYAYRTCADTACVTRQLLGSRVLQAGLPTNVVPGSRVKIYYDPYFVCSNRNSFPQVEIYNGETWNVLEPKSEMMLEFESAGLQKIKVRLSEGGLTVNQTLVVEVK